MGEKELVFVSQAIRKHFQLQKREKALGLDQRVYQQLFEMIEEISDDGGDILSLKDYLSLAQDVAHFNWLIEPLYKTIEVLIIKDEWGITKKESMNLLSSMARIHAIASNLACSQLCKFLFKNIHNDQGDLSPEEHSALFNFSMKLNFPAFYPYLDVYERKERISFLISLIHSGKLADFAVFDFFSSFSLLEPGNLFANQVVPAVNDFLAQKKKMISTELLLLFCEDGFSKKKLNHFCLKTMMDWIGWIEERLKTDDPLFRTSSGIERLLRVLNVVERDVVFKSENWASGFRPLIKSNVEKIAENEEISVETFVLMRQLKIQVEKAATLTIENYSHEADGPTALFYLALIRRMKICEDFSDGFLEIVQKEIKWETHPVRGTINLFLAVDQKLIESIFERKLGYWEAKQNPETTTDFLVNLFEMLEISPRIAEYPKIKEFIETRLTDKLTPPLFESLFEAGFRVDSFQYPQNWVLYTKCLINFSKKTNFRKFPIEKLLEFIKRPEVIELTISSNAFLQHVSAILLEFANENPFELSLEPIANYVFQSSPNKTSIDTVPRMLQLVFRQKKMFDKNEDLVLKVRESVLVYMRNSAGAKLDKTDFEEVLSLTTTSYSKLSIQELLGSYYFFTEQKGETDPIILEKTITYVKELAHKTMMNPSDSVKLIHSLHQISRFPPFILEKYVGPIFAHLEDTLVTLGKSPNENSSLLRMTQLIFKPNVVKYGVFFDPLINFLGKLAIHKGGELPLITVCSLFSLLGSLKYCIGEPYMILLKRIAAEFHLVNKEMAIYVLEGLKESNIRQPQLVLRLFQVLQRTFMHFEENAHLMLKCVLRTGINSPEIKLIFLEFVQNSKHYEWDLARDFIMYSTHNLQTDS